jgi:TPR repeat protein
MLLQDRSVTPIRSRISPVCRFTWRAGFVAFRQIFVRRGHAGAMYHLGTIYLLGHGVAQDAIEAYKWFELSAQTSAGQERDTALRALSALRERLTPLQVGRAMTAVNDWQYVARDGPL